MSGFVHPFNRHPNYNLQCVILEQKGSVNNRKKSNRGRPSKRPLTSPFRPFFGWETLKGSWETGKCWFDLVKRVGGNAQVGRDFCPWNFAEPRNAADLVAGRPVTPAAGAGDRVASWVSALLDIGHYSHARRGPRHRSARSDEAGLVNGGVCALKQDGIPKC